jgi:hypothetical protein
MENMNVTMRLRVLTIATCAALLAGCATPSANASEPAKPAEAKAADHGSNERTVELTSVSPSLWTIRTSSRLVQIQLVDVGGKPHVKMRPVSFEGQYFPYKETTKLSFEVKPGTSAAKAYALRQDGEWQVTVEPIAEKGAFEAAVFMDEGEHYHRLKFAFPGTGR